MMLVNLRHYDLQDHFVQIKKARDFSTIIRFLRQLCTPGEFLFIAEKKKKKTQSEPKNNNKKRTINDVKLQGPPLYVTNAR